MPYDIKHYFCPEHQAQDVDYTFLKCEVPFDSEQSKNSFIFFYPTNHSYLKIWIFCPAKTGVYV